MFQPLVTYVALVSLGLCSADYVCVCNYKDVSTVYTNDSTSSTPIGNLSNWECKQTLNVEVAHQWIPLAYRHQFGYVEKDSNTLLQMCSGSPSESDAIPSTTGSPLTTSRTTNAPIPAFKANTIPPTITQTTTTEAQTHNLHPHEMCRQLQPQHIGPVRHHGHKCYFLFSDSAGWQTAEHTCNGIGGHLVHIEDAHEQAFVERFVSQTNPNRAIWIGLSDIIKEGNYQWTSGGSTSYTNWATLNTHPNRHEYDDCVTMDRQNGQWDDVNCEIRNHVYLDVGDLPAIIG